MTIESTLERIAVALEKIVDRTEKAEVPVSDPKPAAESKPRKQKAASVAAEPESLTAQPSVASSESAAPASDKETDDLFGDPEPAKEEKPKEFTIEDVRAKLVAVQTKLKSKEKAVAILAKVAGSPVLSALKKEQFGTLIAECDKALA